MLTHQQLRSLLLFLDTIPSSSSSWGLGSCITPSAPHTRAELLHSRNPHSHLEMYLFLTLETRGQTSALSFFICSSSSRAEFTSRERVVQPTHTHTHTIIIDPLLPLQQQTPFPLPPSPPPPSFPHPLRQRLTIQSRIPPPLTRATLLLN